MVTIEDILRRQLGAPPGFIKGTGAGPALGKPDILSGLRTPLGLEYPSNRFGQGPDQYAQTAPIQPWFRELIKRPPLSISNPENAPDCQYKPNSGTDGLTDLMGDIVSAMGPTYVTAAGELLFPNIVAPAVVPTAPADMVDQHAVLGRVVGKTPPGPAPTEKTVADVKGFLNFYRNRCGEGGGSGGFFPFYVPGMDMTSLIPMMVRIAIENQDPKNRIWKVYAEPMYKAFGIAAKCSDTSDRGTSICNMYKEALITYVTEQIKPMFVPPKFTGPNAGLNQAFYYLQMLTNPFYASLFGG